MAARVDWHEPPGGASDPRPSAYVRVGDLEVDGRLQRPVTESRVQHIAENWDWAKAEAISVALRAGRLRVTEGQNRTLSLQRRNPDARVLVVLVAEDVSNAQEAAIASGITRGRKPHTPLQLWRLDAERGDEVVGTAERVLAELGLRTGDKTSGHTVSAVTRLRRIMQLRTTPAESGLLLSNVLTVARTIPDAPGQEGRHFDGVLLAALAAIMGGYEDVLDVERLGGKLVTRTSSAWLAMRARSEPGRPSWRGVYDAMVEAYNHSKKTGRLGRRS